MIKKDQYKYYRTQKARKISLFIWLSKYDRFFFNNKNSNFFIFWEDIED